MATEKVEVAAGVVEDVSECMHGYVHEQLSWRRGPGPRVEQVVGHVSVGVGLWRNGLARRGGSPSDSHAALSFFVVILIARWEAYSRRASVG